MRKYIFAAVLMLTAGGASAAHTPAVPAATIKARTGHRLADSLRSDIAFARNRVYPALVNIFVVFRYYEAGRAHRDLAGGSGVIISPKGYVITNYHVAGHTTHIVCTLANGEKIEAKDIYDDPLTDLSVLKLDMNGRTNPKAPLPYATLGNSDTLHVGDFVLAMGNPLMLSSSMTLGIASNTHRVFTNFTGTSIEDQQLDDGQLTGLLTRWIQHDALILPGNSGGPLVNMAGQVVGINELGNNGVGFAIPSNIVRQVFHQAIAYGQVIRGYLGFSPLPVDKLGRTTGTLVAAVAPDSPAAKAGLKAGDILLDLNGTPTNTRFFEQVPLMYQQIAALTPGHSAVLKALRSGKTLTLSAQVSEMPPYIGKETETSQLGITVRSITPSMALSQHLPDTSGVMITGVRPGGPADSAVPRLEEGDVIREADQKKIADLASFRSRLADSGKNGKLVVSYLRDGQKMITVVSLKKEDQDQNDLELPHAWLGVNTEVLTPDIAQALDLPGKQGFLVTQVYPDTDAAESGLKTGDIIASLNGQALQASQPQDEQNLTQAIQNLDVGSKAELGLLRNGRPLTLPVTLQAEPTSVSQAAAYSVKALEFDVRDLTLFDRIKMRLPVSQKGVLVTGASEGGWANIAGLHPEDIILSVNGSKVADIAGFKGIIGHVLAASPHVITLFILRGALTSFVFIEPDWKHLE